MNALPRKGHAAEHLPDLAEFSSFNHLGSFVTFYTTLENQVNIYMNPIRRDPRGTGEINHLEDILDMKKDNGIKC